MLVRGFFALEMGSFISDTIADIDKMIEAKRKLKDKLLTKFVKDHVIIEKHEFMGVSSLFKILF